MFFLCIDFIFNECIINTKCTHAHTFEDKLTDPKCCETMRVLGRATSTQITRHDLYHADDLHRTKACFNYY